MRVLRLLIGLILLVLAVLYLYTKSSLAILYKLDVPSIIALFFATLGLICTRGLQMRFFLIPYGTRIGIREAIYLSEVATLINSIFPLQAGMGFRAFYLHKKHQIKLIHFIWMFIFLTVVHFVFCGLLVSILIGVSYLNIVPDYGAVTFAYLFGIMVTYLVGKNFNKYIKVLYFIPYIKKHFEKYQFGLPAKIYRVLILFELITMFLVAALIIGAGSGIDANFTIKHYVMVSALVSILGTINVTPGNLGIMEWAMALVGYTQGYTVETGLSFILTIRVFLFITVTMLFLPAWYYFCRQGINIFKERAK